MKTVTLYTTSKCNIRCKHCGVGLDQDNPRSQQTTNDLKKVISELASGGTKFITILGGEATIYRNDLPIILDHAEEVGIKVSVNTNLTSWKPIESIIEKPSLNSFIISLDGSTATTHDANRGKGTFEKTVKNLKKLSEHNRIQNKSLYLEIAFVMTGINFHEASTMLTLAKQFNASYLNVKNVKMIGRAMMFSDLLGFNHQQLLDTYTSLILNWMLSDRCFELEVFIPPAYAEFLNFRFGLGLPTSYHPACGGTDVFSYVDLYGNHLPCPAMSYEEKPNTGFSKKIKDLNLIDGDIFTSFESQLFNHFEENRKNRTYKEQLFPCRFCKYNNQCQQCVAEIVSGAKEEVIDICSALYYHGNDFIPNFREGVWINQ
ncbi:MAG: radical SAM protein [Lewinellaceae bacterium]|nr:radical SAM protein [Lewinellaceae bacterium]